jgi:hypothetical protein
MNDGVLTLAKQGFALQGPAAPYPLRNDTKPRAVWPAGLVLDGENEEPEDSLRDADSLDRMRSRVFGGDL